MTTSRDSAFIALLLIAASASAAEIRPADSSKPLLRVLAFQTVEGGEHPGGTVNEHPLLVVSAVSDVQLASDQKGVLIKLTPKDTKSFAAITRKYNHGYLLFEGGELHNPLEVMHITGPIVDGIIDFKYPEPAAEYLRRRFRLAEFK